MEGKSILSETINALERERVEFYRQLKETQTQIRIVDHKIRALKETEIILNGGSVTVSTGTMFWVMLLKKS
jgi:predicted phage tail protein